MPFKPGQSGNTKGRPKGSFTKPRITDRISQQAVDEMVDLAVQLATEGERPDTNLLKFLLEQVYGKAKQAIVGGDEDDEPIKVKHKFDHSLAQAFNNLIKDDEDAIQ